VDQWLGCKSFRKLDRPRHLGGACRSTYLHRLERLGTIQAIPDPLQRCVTTCVSCSKSLFSNNIISE
jgi:hypothetical protein